MFFFIFSLFFYCWGLQLLQGATQCPLLTLKKRMKPGTEWERPADKTAKPYEDEVAEFLRCTHTYMLKHTGTHTDTKDKMQTPIICQTTCDNETMHLIGRRSEWWPGSTAPVWGSAPARACRLPANGPQCIRCAGASVIGCPRPETGSGALACLPWLVEPDPKSCGW